MKGSISLINWIYLVATKFLIAAFPILNTLGWSWWLVKVSITINCPLQVVKINLKAFPKNQGNSGLTCWCKMESLNPIKTGSSAYVSLKLWLMVMGSFLTRKSVHLDHIWSSFFFSHILLWCVIDPTRRLSKISQMIWSYSTGVFKISKKMFQ